MLAEVFRSFLQSLQANAEIVPQIRIRPLGSTTVTVLLPMMMVRECRRHLASSQLKSDCRFLLVPTGKDGEGVLVLTQIESGEHGGLSQSFNGPS
jgi:hypothetical protein